jgi:hypothetical protein
MECKCLAGTKKIENNQDTPLLPYEIREMNKSTSEKPNPSSFLVKFPVTISNVTSAQKDNKIAPSDIRETYHMAFS